METIGIIVICILAGMLLRRFQILKKEDAQTLNRLIIYFFIPVISLLHIPTLTLEVDLLWLTLSPFIVFGCGLVFFGMLRSMSFLVEGSYKSLVLTCGISSTSFVGFPIFELLYGEEGLAYGVLLSLGGTILVFNTVGMVYLMKYSSVEKMSIVQLMKGLCRFVPFLVFMLAVVFNLLSVEYPLAIEKLLTRLASPFSVIALMAIGIQLEIKSISVYKFEIVLGHLYKLVIAPIIIYLVMWVMFDQQNILSKVCILGAGIGSMNAMSVLAAEKNISPQLSLMMPGLSIPASVFTLFVIDYLLS